MKILLLSDTHSYIDDRILHYANEADEVWHCGDFGNLAVIEALQAVKPLRGVYGNIDGTDVRQYFPKVNRFQCEQVEVLMIHIGGYPNKYTPLAKQETHNFNCCISTQELQASMAGKQYALCFVLKLKVKKSKT